MGTVGELATIDRPPSRLSVLGRSSWLALGVLLLAMAAAWLLPRLLLVVVPVTAAGLVTALLRPAVSWLERRGLPLLAATWAVLLSSAATLTGVVLLIAPMVTSEIGALRTSLNGGLTNIEDWLVNGPFHLAQARVDSWSADLQTQVTSPSSSLSQGALAQTPLALHVVAGAVLAVVLTFFFIKDGPAGARWIAHRTSSATMVRLESAWSAVGGYARGLVVNGVVNAVVLGVALVALRVPLALPLASITFVASFIPIAGAIVAGVLAALVALVASGPFTAAVVIGVTALIHHLEGYLVGPLVIGRRTGLHPVVLILSLVVGSIIAGIPGAFLAGPFAAALAGWAAGAPNPEASAP